MDYCFFRGMLEVGLQPAVVKFSGEKSVTNGDPKGFLQFGANVVFDKTTMVQPRKIKR